MCACFRSPDRGYNRAPFTILPGCEPKLFRRREPLSRSPEAMIVFQQVDARFGMGLDWALASCTISQSFSLVAIVAYEIAMTSGAVDAAMTGRIAAGRLLVRHSPPPPWSQRESRESSSARRGRPIRRQQPVFGENVGLRGGRRAINPADAAIPALAARGAARPLFPTPAAVARTGQTRALLGSRPHCGPPILAAGMARGFGS